MEKYKNSCVYWLHLAEHTDPLTTGYVGVSARGANNRFKRHLISVANGSNLIVHNAIRKYGDKIIVTTLVRGSPEYCLLIEEKLRPIAFSPGTWNMCQGGVSKRVGMSPNAEVREKLSNANKGLVKSEATKLKLSAANKGKRLLETTKEKLRQLNQGKVASEEKLEKMRNNMAKVGAWGHSYSVKKVWVNAKESFNYLLDNPSHGAKKLSKYLGCEQTACTSLLKKLRSGWNPSEDIQYLTWLNEYTTEENNAA